MRKLTTAVIVILFLLMVLTLIPVNVSAKSSYFAGGSGTESDPYKISDVTELQNMDLYLDGHYILIDDIDASVTSSWNSGDGFEPVGTSSDKFTGTLDGNGYKITGLYINRSSTDYNGLFGYTYECEINNISLENIYVNGKYYTGGLIGLSSHSTITNSYTTGDIDSTPPATVDGGTFVSSYYTAGLIGRSSYSTITNSYSTCDINSSPTANGSGSEVTSGSHYTGGLIGSCYYSTITNSYATGNINSSPTATGGKSTLAGAYSIGGLLGYTYYTTVTNSSAAGSIYSAPTATGIDVAGASSCNIGGLVGNNNRYSQVLNSSATGSIYSASVSIGGSSCYESIAQSTSLGGLVGVNSYRNQVSNSYARGNVTSSPSATGGTETESRSYYVGGLVGNNRYYSEISNCYSTGIPSGDSDVGGLVGYTTSGTTTNSYWDTETSGLSTSDGGTGKTTAEMKQVSTYTGWDFNDIWRIDEDFSYPYHKWQQTPEEAVEEIISETEDLELEEGLENSLVSKLANILKSIDSGNNNAAIKQLEAFINQVEALRGKKLTEDEADALIAAAQEVIDKLGA
jgi:hypothetical protein